MTRPTRILHCPFNQTGHAYHLAREERVRGFDSRLVALRGEPYGFPADEVLAPIDAGALAVEAARLRLLVRAIRWADVVHFNFGSPVFRPWPPRHPHDTPASGPRRVLRRTMDLAMRTIAFKDLAALDRLGKKIFVTYEGSDARGHASSRLVDDPIACGVLHDAYPVEGEAGRERLIEAFDRVANDVFAVTPDLLDHLPRGRFVPAASVDVAVVPATPRRRRTDKPVVIAHAPTSRVLKGTAFLLDAVARLRAEGANVELSLIEGVSHDDALRLLRSADVIVDQLILGWYGVVAVEAMAAHTPVVCYLSDAALERAPETMRNALPILRASPSTIDDALRKLGSMAVDELKDHGDAGRPFAEQWHSPRAVAELVCAAYAEAGVAPTS